MTYNIPFKQWKHEEAARRGITVRALEQQMARDKSLVPPLIVAGKRTFFVMVEKEDK